MNAGASQRAGLAAATFGLGASTAYVALRLASKWGGEPVASTVIATAHIPYFWRVGLAVFLGAVAASIAGLAFGEEATGRWLSRVGTVTLPLVVVLLALAFAVP